MKPFSLLLLLLLSTSFLYSQKSANINLDSISFGSNKKVQPSKSISVVTPSPSNTHVGKDIIGLLDNPTGSFIVNLENENLALNNGIKFLSEKLDLGKEHTFKQIRKEIEDNGRQHFYYQYLFKGYPVEGCIIGIHENNGFVKLINGRLQIVQSLSTEISYLDNEFQKIALNHLSVDTISNLYPVTYTFVREDSEWELAAKVRIDAWSPFTMKNVFIHCRTGEVIKSQNLIAHADTPGTGVTMYSGTQSITCDSYLGNYRLRDNARSIETYDATNATGLTASGFTGSSDFTNNSTTWTGVPVLSSLTINSVQQSWWYAVFADESPDLYFVLKDASNSIIYTSPTYQNTFPTIIFANINAVLVNPPYTIEVWDYDAVGGDDYGGSFALNTTTGSYSIPGGLPYTGSYQISNSGHPGIDVHWGMEVTYDYYLNILGRDSYDNAGGLIKQYLNSPLTQSSQGGEPNNAFAMGSPYNIMVYGMGDGSSMKPVVGLDVEGHEFTHLVVNSTAQLVYEAESGALNESFADIFGTSIEFYGGPSPDWLIGEDVMISATALRSMSNPNLYDQPDTYQGQYWANTSNLTQDHGGVHTNSGVQNFWFYLLSQGGSGTNDIGNGYNVTGIGVSDAQAIAYRNLTVYLSSNSTYYDAYLGSLQAAEDLFGNPSTQYLSVQQAWYAVGIGNNPNQYCSGTTNLTATSGTFNDGSGTANYFDNANCKWVIAPAGATQIHIDFTYFDTETDYDTVFVYDGPDETGNLLATWWGNTLPPTISTTAGVGAMCVVFKSDASVNYTGWEATYYTTGITPTCSDGEILATPSGSFSDGSGGGNYGNNQFCYWTIAPPCATSVTLSFSAFDTEANYDGVVIYDDISGSNQIGVYSGTTIPSNITSNTGVMVVAFVSDYSSTYGGFTANYTSTGSGYCSGTSIVNASDYGTITDGSGTNDYCNNQDCQWLIQPPQATSITLNFTEFMLENPSSDGQTIYDAVEVYDGSTTGAPLLGVFSGGNLPPTLTSSGGSMLVRFYSDLSVTNQGWSANFTSTQNSYCSSITNLTSSSGSFSDGSGGDDYANNSSCSWLIQPPNATTITLNFSSFDTEANNDGVVIYDGPNNSYPVLAQYSGSSIPASVTSSCGSIYVEFLSNDALRKSGWDANYISTYATDVISACGSYTWVDGNTYTNNNNTATYAYTNQVGCDSVVTLDLSLYTVASGVDVVTACAPYVWIDGNTYTSNNNTATHLISSGGCDSTVTLNLTIVSSTSGTDVVSECAPYLWIDGNTYTTDNNTATHVIPNSNGCDSTVTLDLTIIPATTGIDVVTGCASYQWIDGIYYSSNNNTATYTLTNSNGCDSVVTLNLTINPLPDITVSQNGATLTANQNGATYQWIDCNNSFLPINGETNQSYTAPVSGTYAVQVNLNGCTNTSSCTQVNFADIDNIESELISIFPNPVSDILFISGINQLNDIKQIEVTSASGALAMKMNEIKSELDISELSTGVYFLKISHDKGMEVIKFVKD